MTWVQFAKSMWAEWWLVLAALALVLLVLLGLLWLVIEFPGLTGWKVVHKESPEGRARQERWRRDSLVIEQMEKRGKRRLRKVGVDQGVQCLMEVEEAAEVEVVVEASPKLEEGEVGQAREDILKEVEEAVAGVAVEVLSLVVEALLVEEVEGGCFFYFKILNNCRT